MKKPFIYLLTAGLAFSMITNTAYAAPVEDESSPKTSEATVTFEAPVDGLTLDSVSDITFGTVPISNEDFDITSLGSPSLTVSDFRGTSAGWHVTAALSEFSNTERAETDTLQAAELGLIGNEVVSSVDESKVLPTTTITSNDELGAIPVVNASEGTGAGVSTANWSSANLVVPESVLAIATQGTHTATITWTLDDAPQ